MVQRKMSAGANLATGGVASSNGWQMIWKVIRKRSGAKRSEPSGAFSGDLLPRRNLSYGMLVLHELNLVVWCTCWMSSLAAMG